MKKILLILIISCNAVIFMCCSKMNDNIDIYMREGEDIYIGKIDSLNVFPGNERVFLRFWAADIRAKTANIHWYPNADSISVELNRVSRTDSFEVAIGALVSDKTIEEGSYTFNIVTQDDNNHRSLAVEKIVKVYGENYRSTLSNRNLNGIEYDQFSSSLSLIFDGAINEDEIGIELKFSDLDGIDHLQYIENEDIGESVTITNINAKKGVSFRSLFLPEPNAIDTFYVDFAPVELIQIVNVALNKPVKVSGTYSASYVGSKAVDGVFTTASRWLSKRTIEEDHWIEIDLEDEYDLFSFKTWITTEIPIPEFMFQVEIDGEWKNVVVVAGNSDPQFEATFPQVKTSKVRYFVPANVIDLVRMYEIEVYAKIRI